MARRSITEDTEESTEINLSPMIDCIFILLIFFIVTTVFVEESGIQINKPDASQAPPSEETESVVFEISQDNKVWFEGKSIGIQGVSARVKRSLKDDETPITIKAHEKSDHGVFVTVWDEVQNAGAKKISFSTIN